jgi:hypothetical protein
MEINNFSSAILENKNDLKENTFCYKLHEEKIFDYKKLFEIIENIKEYYNLYKIYVDSKSNAKKIKEILFWILSSTYSSLIHHYNKNDLYKINKFINGNEEDAIESVELLGSHIYELLINI